MIRTRFLMTVDGLLLPSGDGATARFLETARSLSLAGHDVTIVHCFREWSDWQQLAAEPFRTILMHPADFYRGRDVWQAVLRQCAPQVFQVHEEALIVSLLDRDLVPHDASLVFECHNAVHRVEGGQTGEPPALPTLFAAHVADHTVCLTEREAEILREGGASAEAIPCTIAAAERPRRHRGQGRDLAFLGHYFYEPNAEAARWIVNVLLPRVTASLPDARVHLFGHAPAALRRELSQPNVIWWGYVEDAAASLAQCDVALAIALRGSGFRTKLLHYMAAGVPVVGTAIGVRGIGPRACFAVASDADVLARACVELCRDPGLRARQAAEALGVLRREFGRDALVARYQACFANLPRSHDSIRFRRRAAEFALRFGLRDLAGFQRRLCTDRPAWLQELVRKQRFDWVEPSAPVPGEWFDLRDLYHRFTLDHRLQAGLRRAQG